MNKTSLGEDPQIWLLTSESSPEVRLRAGFSICFRVSLKEVRLTKTFSYTVTTLTTQTRITVDIFDGNRRHVATLHFFRLDFCVVTALRSWFLHYCSLHPPSSVQGLHPSEEHLKANYVQIWRLLQMLLLLPVFGGCTAMILRGLIYPKILCAPEKEEIKERKRRHRVA